MELEQIITISVLSDFSFEFLSQLVNKTSCDIFHDIIFFAGTLTAKSKMSERDPGKWTTPPSNFGTGTLRA